MERSGVGIGAKAVNCGMAVWQAALTAVCLTQLSPAMKLASKVAVERKGRDPSPLRKRRTQNR